MRKILNFSDVLWLSWCRWSWWKWRRCLRDGSAWASMRSTSICTLISSVRRRCWRWWATFWKKAMPTNELSRRLLARSTGFCGPTRRPATSTPTLSSPSSRLVGLLGVLFQVFLCVHRLDHLSAIDSIHIVHQNFLMVGSVLRTCYNPIAAKTLAHTLTSELSCAISSKSFLPVHRLNHSSVIASSLHNVHLNFIRRGADVRCL